MLPALWLAMLLVLRIVAVRATYGISVTFLNQQDRWLLLLDLALAGLALAPWWRWPRIPPWSLRHVVVLAVVVAIACYAGHVWLLSGYDLSRDEQMAVFDTRIYATGAMAWPIPPAWRGDADALNLLFMLPVEHPVAWVSAYLPGNSVIRAAVGMIADPAWTNPLLTGGTLIAVWGVARRMWGDTPSSAALAVALLALSGQVVFTGMTAYAMPAHLFFNMVWLWLFLADRRGSDLAALAVGFVAIGLHQPLFHPMFVAPWLALLLWQRRWGRLALYTVPYAGFGLFWLAWPQINTLPRVMGPGSVRDVGADILSRLIDTLGSNQDNLSLMACNLLRFCTWQAVPMVPLIIAGLYAIWRARHRDPRGLALAAGLILPVVVMAAILPYQGHGFGYRYLHQVLGNAALIAVIGWRAIAPWHARLRPVLAVALIGSVAALALQGWMLHRLYGVFARESAAITATHADYAVIGAEDGPYALDLVLNRPDLSNRPIRLSAGDIDDADALAARLCRGGGVSVALPVDAFFGEADALFGRASSHQASGRFEEARTAFESAGCSVSPLR
jgi:hypothetical protein